MKKMTVNVQNVNISSSSMLKMPTGNATVESRFSKRFRLFSIKNKNIV